jgi:ribonuclease E
MYLLAARQNAWLPPLAMICPSLVAFGLSFRKAEAPAEDPVETGADPLPDETPPPEQDADPIAEADGAAAEDGAPARKTARKTARKAATKTAAKKAPAKKAARKSARKPAEEDSGAPE